MVQIGSQAEEWAFDKPGMCGYHENQEGEVHDQNIF